MTAKELIVFNNTSNTESLFKAARKVPADKLEWKPLDAGRSVLDQCAECALSPTWAFSVLDTEKPFEMTPEIIQAFQDAKAQLKTIDDCEALAKENLAKLNDFVMAYPDEKLRDTVPMPMWPGGQMPVIEALQLHNWNVSYHTGQVNYIQTLYGDNGM